MPRRCEFCGQGFDSEEELIKHIKISHGERIKLDKFEHPHTRNEPAD